MDKKSGLKCIWLREEQRKERVLFSFRKYEWCTIGRRRHRRLFGGRDSFIWSVAAASTRRFEPQHLSGAFEFLQHWKGCD